MLIAVAAVSADAQSEVDPRFGRAAYFAIYDSETDKYEFIENTQNRQAAQGAGIQAAQNVAAKKVDWVVSGNFGPKAFAVLKAAGAKPVQISGGTVTEAVEAIKSGKMDAVDGATKDGHWM